MTKIAAFDLKTLIDSLKDETTSLLVIDTKLCPHSRRLLDEVEVACCLKAPSSSPKVMHIVDLSSKDGPAVHMLTWLPGVPCLLAASQVHLGVDAFAKCRELCSAPEGLTIHHLP